MTEEEKIESQENEENKPQEVNPPEEEKKEEFKPEVSAEETPAPEEAKEEPKEEPEEEKKTEEETLSPEAKAEGKEEDKEEAKEEAAEKRKEEPKDLSSEAKAKEEEERKEEPKEEQKKAPKIKKKKEKKAPAEKVKEAKEDKEEAKEEPKEEPKEEEKGKEKSKGSWYVVQTFSGQEDRVKESIARNVESMNMQHKIFKVLVPEEETVEIKGGKRIEKVRKMFPGYVFIEMILDEESWYVIRGTPGVAKFIGTKIEPTPVSDKEMQRVLKQIGIKEEKLEAAFDIGESVRIISGPFRGYTGSIDEVNAQKGKLKTLINIFGRDTPVEVNFEQVQKIT